MPSSSTTQPKQVKNYSLLSIPAAYALAFPPYIYHFTKSISLPNSVATNVIPRENLAALQPTISKATYSILARTRGAHLNALESFPLFAAAMLGANYLLPPLPTTPNAIALNGNGSGNSVTKGSAPFSARDLNILGVEYLGVRVLFTLLYVGVKTEATSYLRSTAYFWSIGIPFYMLWKVSWAVAERSALSEPLGMERLDLSGREKANM